MGQVDDSSVGHGKMQASGIRGWQISGTLGITGQWDTDDDRSAEHGEWQDIGTQRMTDKWDTWMTGQWDTVVVTG